MIEGLKIALPDKNIKWRTTCQYKTFFTFTNCTTKLVLTNQDANATHHQPDTLRQIACIWWHSSTRNISRQIIKKEKKTNLAILSDYFQLQRYTSSPFYYVCPHNISTLKIRANIALTKQGVGGWKIYTVSIDFSSWSRSMFGIYTSTQSLVLSAISVHFPCNIRFCDNSL